MLKHLVPIVAATLLLLIVWASSVPLFHWFEIDDVPDEIAQKQAQWRDLGIDSYEYVVRKICICGPPGNIPVRIIVRDSRNIAAFDDRSSHDPSSDRIDGVPHTVPELFELARSANADPRAQVVVGYDRQFGFPDRIQLSPDSDDAVNYSISLFRVLEGGN